MRYTLSVTAYDYLDRVMVTVRTHEYDDDGQFIEEAVVSTSVSVLGTGQSSPQQWTIDTLVAALETL